MAMGEFVSQIENALENEQSKNVKSYDLWHEAIIQYRFLRKQISSFIRKQLKKNFINILLISPQKPPTEYILSFQKQYPDKAITVIIPLFEDAGDTDKLSFKFDYFLQNKKHSAAIYRIPSGYDNVKVFGVFTEVFSNIKKEQEIYDIKYLSHYTKIVRKAALKLKPDIIHADNIPFLLGLELDGKWISGYPIKYVQVLHDLHMYKPIEPFWAAINLANKQEMNKICNNKIIRNNLASIFNIDPSEKSNKTKACINFIYKKYDEYRANVSIDENTKENILLQRMNERILKLFPKTALTDNMFNPSYYSLKQASARIVNSYSGNKPDWTETLKDISSIPVKFNEQYSNTIHHPFDKTNFRETRELNKRYLVRELSEKRIEMEFCDMSLFGKENVNIRGYLDSFYRAPLFFVPINEYADTEYIKSVSLAILKAFELRKNIQVIYNFPKDFNNTYLRSLLDFFETQQALNGKWVSFEGEINLPQFLSASDMVLIPSGNCLNIENTIYLALQYGCIPVVSTDGVGGEIVPDIFDDMNTGCGFKNCTEFDEKLSYYEALFLKALEFYNNNKSSWNLIIENAINYESGWDFDTIKKYNDIYENIL